jgi:aminoglycoside 6-adenylyltransferase
VADSSLTGAPVAVDKVSDTESERVAATGILLVGGKSERFGSPKAVAAFRGETLAERGWRTLGAAFEEVVAIGKAEDALDLPFPVLDDGAGERAPVSGVLAGLRAASHEVCVVLPVDCPLVSAETLRRLAEERAVPQTGPLPGAYTKDLLPTLERRVAAGELSLRGVNPTVVEVDDAELLNVNTRLDLIAAAIADWALARDDVKAAVVVGSQSRADTPADRWSDLDVILLVDDPEPYAEDESWVAEFGNPVLTFLEPTAVGDQRERRVLYEDGEDVDLPLIPVAALERIDRSEDVPSLLARGYRVLVDKIGLSERLPEVAATARPPDLPTQRQFTELASDFWFHGLWTARKLRRGEILTAQGSLVRLLLSNTVTLLGWHARALDPSADTWHGTRFVERWADPGVLAALESAFPRYDVRDVARALWATIDLWQGLEEETARRLGLAVEVDHADLRRRISEVVPQPGRASTL